jgi:hypothetical protein
VAAQFPFAVCGEWPGLSSGAFSPVRYNSPVQTIRRLWPSLNLSLALIVSGATLASCPLAPPACAQSKVPRQQANAAQDVPAVHALAMTLFQQMATDKLDRSLLTPQASTALTPALLTRIQPSLAALGKLEGLQFVAKTPSQDGTFYVYRANFRNGVQGIRLFVASDGKVGAYRITGDPTGTIPDDPKVHALATTVFEQLLHNTVQPALFSKQMQSALTPRMRAQTAENFAALGQLLKLTLRQKTTRQSGISYGYSAEFAKGPQSLQIFVQNDGKVGGFWVRP